jgi:hypothetical protein
MSRYREFKPERLKDYPLASRKSKVATADFAKPPVSPLVADFLDSLPGVLGAEQLRRLSAAIRSARDQGRGIIWAFGGHVVKVGLAPVIVDLMERGFVTALATNGSGMIHDFEIALSGKTSEDVDAALPDGTFGMARETGSFLNHAIREGAQEGKGIGESVGHFLKQHRAEYGRFSLALQAYQRGIPLTVHVAVGTDIIHNHPDCSGEALGKGSMIDFRILADQVSLINDGGVFLNIGSAVLLPEVFLKALTLVRSAGVDCSSFTTANLDFIQHYRPTQNVVTRPVAGSGRGIALTGHHEIMVPLLAASLVHGTDSSTETDSPTVR